MRAIGIDLGTTNSVMAIVDGELRVLPNRSGETFTPSVVSFYRRRNAPEGGIVIGLDAISNAQRAPENTIYSIKRLMGRQYGDHRIDEVKERYSFKLAPPPAPHEGTEDYTARVLLNGEPYTPEQVSSFILKQLKADAELALGEPVTHAVITVPAYFEEQQRHATQEAGRLAGLTVVELIDEPTAAALAFGFGKEEERHRLLVYDLGGGTFDISLIQMFKGNYSVLEIQGNNWLGGDDFDTVILKKIVAWVQDEHGFDASKNQEFLTKALPLAQRAKMGLSSQQEVEITGTVFNVWDQGPIDIELSIARGEFEEELRPMLEQTIDLVHKALDNQSLSPDDVTGVLLVGGSTAIPMVHALLVEVFGAEKIKRHVNPMQCVAIGAAIHAASFEIDGAGEASQDDEASGSLQKITAMHLGIAALVGDDPEAFVPIIEKGTPYPLSEPISRVFYPSARNMKLIRVPVFEGMERKANLNEQQGVIEIPLSEGIDTATPIEVAFNYDRNRILTVRVRVLGTDISTEERLRRGHRREAPSKLIGDDWREEVDPALRVAKVFLHGYRVYLEQEDIDDLAEAIKTAEQALLDEDEKSGRRAMLVLDNKVMGSGVGSLLFLAESAARSAAARVAPMLTQRISAVRQAYGSGDPAALGQAVEALTVLLAQMAPAAGSVSRGGPVVPQGMLRTKQAT